SVGSAPAARWEKGGGAWVCPTGGLRRSSERGGYPVSDADPCSLRSICTGAAGVPAVGGALTGGTGGPALPDAARPDAPVETERRVPDRLRGAGERTAHR